MEVVFRRKIRDCSSENNEWRCWDDFRTFWGSDKMAAAVSKAPEKNRVPGTPQGLRDSSLHNDREKENAPFSASNVKGFANFPPDRECTRNWQNSSWGRRGGERNHW